jgi:hypothetical protein
MNFSKATFIQVIVAAIAMVLLVASACSIASVPIEVKRIKPMDSSILEEWTRVTDNEDVLGASASKSAENKSEWQVFINVAEFVREEPLESKLHQRITDSLRSIDGVVEVIHEDREVWLVRGNVSGESLVRSSATVLNELHKELAAAVENL